MLRPFWWPMNMKETPPMEASPHTMAGSSSPALSPCSSTNLRSTGSSAVRRCWTHPGESLSHWTLVLAPSHRDTSL